MAEGWTFDLRGDFERSSRLEWLETNGLGGYASSTACGANTRRYHGLLVAATRPPVGRIVLLSKLDERLTVGGVTYDLSTNHYPGALHPRGFEMLDSFSRDLFPVFDFSIDGVRLRKTIAAIHGQNTTLILYELLQSRTDVVLELRPFIAARDCHSLLKANDLVRRDADFSRGVFSLQAYAGVPTLFISVPGSDYQPDAGWYYRFEYPIERERGFEHHEDLFTPGSMKVLLRPGSRLAVMASTEDPTGRDAGELFDAERIRREALLEAAALPGRLGRSLTLAADQFIVRRGEEGKTIIAGYHWFSDWGRDTMIALPGLCLATRRFDDARRILMAFAGIVSEGMLPNHFPEGGEEPPFNTVDATLWFFVAVRKYLDATGDAELVRRSLFPVLSGIMAWHRRGTRHDIHEDTDGLLSAGSGGDQLTWMDARVGDLVVTPRHGKAVEVQALWYNALRILADFEQKWGTERAAQELSDLADRVLVRFPRLFWNDERGCLFDVVDGEYRDPSLRPNQIFAISLPYPLITGGRAESVLAAIETYLLTPVGLRSLEQDDPRFHATYQGGPEQRDAAYHQGTVWSWLLGPYFTAVARVRGRSGISVEHLLTGLEPHLAEVCAGSISEIFDGAWPHHPRGCAAQAWSVGEILRVMREEMGSTPI
jgi:predicted glycogen debranching enzyme